MRNFEQPFDPGNESQMREPSVESESQKELEEEFNGFEMNLDKVQNATVELGGSKEIAQTAKDLTSEQKSKIEKQIQELRKDFNRHKDASMSGLEILNPLSNLMYMFENEGLLENKIAPFLGYVSGGVPLIGLVEFLRNGVMALKDKNRLRGLEKEKERLEESS